MTNAALSIALMAANPLPEMAEGQDAPEWVHVLPVTEGGLETVDGRGPYYVRDAKAIISASMADGEIPIDQDHATAKAAPRGEQAPARGWISEMAIRDGGIWGKVRWTPEGRELVATQAYRRLSPVIRHRLNGDVIAVREVSLVNRPNLRGLHALNQEESEMLNPKVLEILGLPEDATEEQMLEALQKAVKPVEEGDLPPAAQAELDRVAQAVGVEAGSSVDDIITAAQAAQNGTDELVALQAEVNDLKTEGKRRKAEDFVDGAIRECRVGVMPQRDEFVSMHMANPDQAERIIGNLPKLERTETDVVPPRGVEGVSEMSAQELANKASAYQAKCATEGRIIDAAQAVQAVQEGQA